MWVYRDANGVAICDKCFVEIPNPDVVAEKHFCTSRCALAYRPSPQRPPEKEQAAA